MRRRVRLAWLMFLAFASELAYWIGFPSGVVYWLESIVVDLEEDEWQRS